MSDIKAPSRAEFPAVPAPRHRTAPRSPWTGGHGWPCSTARCIPAAGSRSASPGRTFPKRGWAPVSYTHLDVYKRQPAELATMPGDRCILQLRGLPPFYSPKYDLKQHLSLIHICSSFSICHFRSCSAHLPGAWQSTTTSLG